MSWIYVFLAAAIAVVAVVAAATAEAVAASTEEDDENEDDPETRVTAKAIRTHIIYSIPLLRSANFGFTAAAQLAAVWRAVCRHLKHTMLGQTKVSQRFEKFFCYPPLEIGGKNERQQEGRFLERPHGGKRDRCGRR